jgi:hypothetical protein
MAIRKSSRVNDMSYTYTIHKNISRFSSEIGIEENETGQWILLSILKEDLPLIEDKNSSVYRIYKYLLNYHPELLI